MARGKRWVVLTTGGTQRYIFATNRRRHAVAASHLVHEVGTTWVSGAARAHGLDDPVLAISGKAYLLIDDADVEAARSVVRDVTSRAAQEAPGLQVLGAIGPEFDAAHLWRDGLEKLAPDVADQALDHARALKATLQLAGQVQARLPEPERRDLVVPWSLLCRESGLPVRGRDLRAPEKPLVSAPLLARAAALDAARDRLKGDVLTGIEHVLPEDEDSLGGDGWVAVIHADGNGVGRLFNDLPRWMLALERHRAASRGAAPPEGLSLDAYRSHLGELALELDRATRTAFLAAVKTVEGRPGQRTPRRTALEAGVVPIVVGGDDVTVVCRAAHARAFVKAFLREFEVATAVQPTLAGLVGEMHRRGAPATEASGMTAAAGIAYVKPHHPFAAAYDLAEQLTRSAKSLRRVTGADVSGYDLQVLHDSRWDDVEGLRRSHGSEVPRHPGPYAVSDDHAGGPRGVDHLTRAIATIRGLPNSAVHDLREGAVLGREAFRRRVEHLALSPQLGASGPSAEAVRALLPETDDAATLLFDAMLLAGIEPQAASLRDDEDAGDVVDVRGAASEVAR